MKYELGESKVFMGIEVYRVVALKSFGNVTKGDIGGWVEDEDNLSQQGNCWIFDEAMAVNRSMVAGNAEMHDYSKMLDDSMIWDHSRMYDNAQMCNNSGMYDNSKMLNNSEMHDSSEMWDNSKMSGNSKMFNNSRMYGTAELLGNSKMRGDSIEI
mgnify:CR=1 FL=1